MRQREQGRRGSTKTENRGKGSVLYVLPKSDYFTQGRRGRVTHALGVAQGLSGSGIAVTMISGPGLSSYRAELGSSIRLEELKPLGRNPIAKFRWGRRLASRVAELIQSDSNILFVIIRYRTSNGIMFVGLPRRFPHICWSFEVNSLFYHLEYGLPGFLQRWSHRLEQALFKRMDALYVVSENLKKELAKDGVVRPERVLVAPNAAPLEVAEAVSRVRKKPADGTVRFVYLGVLQTYYELEVVNEAFVKARRAHPGIELHFFGDGPQLAKMQVVAAESRGVEFHGRYDLPRLVESGVIGEDWVLLLPYKHAPITVIGSPTKLFEYMALGQPIIASRVGQIAEVLEEGVTALFYQPGDSDSLASCMAAMIQDVDLRQKMGKAVQREFASKHTWQKRMGALYQGLESLIG